MEHFAQAQEEAKHLKASMNMDEDNKEGRRDQEQDPEWGESKSSHSRGGFLLNFCLVSVSRIPF